MKTLDGSDNLTIRDRFIVAAMTQSLDIRGEIERSAHRSVYEDGER